MPVLNGAELVVRLLERQGVRTVAGIPGGACLPLYDALAGSPRIRHVLARHEQGAGFIAQGMARASGRPAVCIASSGPGATNLVTALADAKLDSIPLVCITGQVARPLIGTDAFQEVDVYGLSIPITKHNFLVRSAAELLSVIPEAFRIAASGRPGPVWVDIPKDVQTETLELTDWPQPGQPDPVPVFDPADIQRAAAMINAASRPVLYLGGGVVHSGAAGLAQRLAEKAGLPTTSTLMALGALQALAAVGRRVPDDVAVVGFDDAPAAASARPALTTVRQPTVELGRALARLLLARISTGEPQAPVVLPTEIVRRDSA